MRKYGLPWQGSKAQIADWVVDVLPRAHTLVDLFAGGCAVTHAAALSGKWERVIACDITDSPAVFVAAAHGEYHGMSTVLTRREFAECDDTMLRLLYSFGNDRQSYLWGADLEPVKVAAAKMLSAPSMHERRMHYRDFCKALVEYLQENGTPRAEKLAGDQALEGL